MEEREGKEWKTRKKVWKNKKHKTETIPEYMNLKKRCEQETKTIEKKENKKTEREKNNKHT